MGCNNSIFERSANDSLHSFHSHHSIDKIRVEFSANVLIVGDSRVKVATATILKQLLKHPQYSNRELNVNICTKDPNSTKMNMIKKDGIDVIEGEMSDLNSLTKAIKKCAPDTIFIVTPSSSSRVNEAMSLIQQCKRSGVGHIILLSNNSIEISRSSIFVEQFSQIENFLQLSGLSYTIVRIPMYLDNYLSQLDSIATYGIFYQPLAPFCEYSSIAIIDVAEAVAKIILNPGKYSDAIINLNGPLICGSSAAEAFSVALGKIVTYEQISYQSFRDCLLMSNTNEWQANAMIELFKIYEEYEEVDSNSSIKVLQDILCRQPTDIIALAKAAVDDSGLGAQSSVKVSPRGSYKFNANIRVTKFSPQFNQWPAGCVGILTVTMILVKNQKLKSSLKNSTISLDKGDNSILGSPKRKGVRFFSDDVNDVVVSSVDITPDTNSKRFSFTDEHIEESQEKTSPLMLKSNPLTVKINNFESSSNDKEDDFRDQSITTDGNEMDEPIDSKFLENVKVEGKILSKNSLVVPDSPDSPDSHSIVSRERFNSIDSDSGRRRNSFDISPKITFGDQIHGFQDEEENEIEEELNNKEYVTLHLHSKFVILLEGNITFIPVHTYTSSMKSGSTPQGSPATTPVQSGRKQLFGMSPNISLKKTLARKSIENSMSMLTISTHHDVLDASGSSKASSEVRSPNTNDSGSSSPSHFARKSISLKGSEEKVPSMVTHTIGSVENKSFFLRGYSVKADKRNPFRIIINGLKSKGKLFFLDTSSDEDHHRWMQCLHSHIEFEDNKFDNVNTMII